MKMTLERAIKAITIKKVVDNLLKDYSTMDIGLYFDDIPKAASEYYKAAKNEVDVEAKAYVDLWNDLEDRETGGNVISLHA